MPRGPLALALLLVLALVAGCTAPSANIAPGSTLPSDVGATISQAGKLVMRAGENATARIPAEFNATMRLIGHDAAEPTLGVQKDGTLYYAAATFANDIAGQPFPGGLPRTDILRSDDGGATWKDVTPYLPGGIVRTHFETGDPYVYVDPATDRVFDIDQRLATTCHSVTFTNDKGKTWSPDADACQSPPADHQTIVAAKVVAPLQTVGYPNVVMVCQNQIADVSCMRSLDGGQSFLPATSPYAGAEAPQPEDNPTDLNSFCGSLHGHLKAAADGTIYLPKNHCGTPTLAITKDSGVTWTQSKVSAKKIKGADPAVGVDAAGNVHYVWMAEDGLLYLASSHDKGAKWTEPVVITPAGLTATHLPAVAAGADGTVVVAFLGTSVAKGYDASKEEMKVATWDGYISVITGAMDASPTVTTARVNPADDPLVRGPCGPGRCPGNYDFIDVVVAKDGRPWAAFVDACTEKCALPDGKVDDQKGRAGFVATLDEGFSLLDATMKLPPLPIAGGKASG